MKIMITGGCGYVARNLINEVGDRHELLLVDQVRPEDATMFNPNTAERDKSPLVTRWPFKLAAVTDTDAMLAATEGVDVVIHLAAAVQGFWEHAASIMQANVHGTFNLMDAARKNGVRRFLCASSINAFGVFYWRVSDKPVTYKSMPLTEDFPVVYEDPYSLSKHVNELTCATFTRAFGMTTAAFRFAGVWNQPMYDEIRKTGLKPTTEWSDKLYQWVHVEDVARGLLQAAEHPKLPAHGVYSLGGPDTLAPEPTMELLERFRPDLAKNVTRPLPGRAPLLCIDAARDAFGYAPRYRMAD